jgi:rhodanese-related sulfurtransferase
LISIALSLLWTSAASGVGLLYNSLRAKGIPLVAPFAYDHDCPEKLDNSSATIDAKRALALAQSKRVKDARGRRGAVLVDARPLELFKKEHAPKARSFPYSFVTPFSKKDAAKLAAYAHVFVYCDSPEDRLANVQAAQMKKQGLDQVKVVIGGLDALLGRQKKKSTTGNQP